jgi:hypothetical protein
VTPQRRKLRPLAVLAIVALIGAGCGSNGAAENGTTGTTTSGDSGGTKHATSREQAVRFAQCMRDNGVSEFPDPNAAGELTIDEIANGSSLNPNAASFTKAISACKDLEPAGFTGGQRSAQQQESALKFAQCMRENGVKDFPDPANGEPLVNTERIPSSAGNGGMSRLNAAMQKCGATFADELGLGSK